MMDYYKWIVRLIKIIFYKKNYENFIKKLLNNVSMLKLISI